MSDLRFGVSAMSTNNMNIAEPDEMMIHPKTGKVYYKRNDGIVVAYDNTGLSEQEVKSYHEMLETSGPVNADYILHYEVDIAGIMDMKASGINRIPYTVTFDNYAQDGRFMIYMHSTPNVNTTARYLCEVGKSLDENFVSHKITFSITYHCENGDTTKEIVVSCDNFDNGFSVVPKADIPTDKGAYLYATIQLVSIEFPVLGSVLGGLDQNMYNQLKLLNHNNVKMDPMAIDFITYGSKTNMNMDIISIDKRVQLMHFIPVNK